MASQLNHLAFAAHKAALRKGYIAYFLAKYREIESLSEEELIENLGCSVENYHRLVLCRAPKQNHDEFADRIQRIADIADISAVELARILKRVTAFQKRIEIESSSYKNRLMLAARDHQKSNKIDKHHKDEIMKDQNE